MALIIDFLLTQKVAYVHRHGICLIRQFNPNLDKVHMPGRCIILKTESYGAQPSEEKKKSIKKKKKNL